MAGIIDFTCTCGAHYRVPDRLAGKSARCKRCGAAVSIPLPAETEDDGLAVEAEPESASSSAASREPAMVISQPRNVVIGGQTAGAAQRHSTGSRPQAGGHLAAYFRDCVWSVAFIAEPGNIVPFLVVAAIAALQPVLAFGMCLGSVGRIMVMGWIFSFLFNVILQAANGERELPELTLTEGLVHSVVMPFFKFVAAWVLAMSPLLLYTLVMRPQPDPGNDGMFYLLAAVGAFLWPMTILILAVGGVASLGRPDLILRTMVRTIGPYTFTRVMTAGALVAGWFLRDALVTAGSGSHPIALVCMLEVVELYFLVIVMRFIGLYYHHFKARFAWSWE